MLINSHRRREGRLEARDSLRLVRDRHHHPGRHLLLHPKEGRLAHLQAT
jgi:hypothetical protein